MRSVLVVCALIFTTTACNETGLTARDDQGTPTDTDSQVNPIPSESSDPEICDLSAAPANEVGIDEDCIFPSIVVDDPWNVDIKWQYTVSSGSGSFVMPAIGNLSDDNGDGVIDEHDNPDIVFASLSGHIIALHGDGTGELWTFTGINGNGGVAIADVDNDGVPEVIAYTSGRQVVAINADGTEKWRSPVISSMGMYPQPVVGDLNGDGNIEVVMDVAIVNGADGSLSATLSPPSVPWRAPVIADVDADGISEILLGNNAYRPDGTVKWSIPSTSGDSVFAAVADIDGDVGGESFWVWGSQMHVMDDDGTLIRSVTLPGSPSRPGPPAIADFDGDGDVEIVVPMNSQIGMFEVDGTLRWTQEMRDFSGIAGVSGYDIDGDGIYEAIFADEVAFRIYDGATGAVRYENFSHSSGTVWEYPTIADINNDGSAEIVITSQGSTWRGVTVFGHAGGGWAEAGPVWPVHDFAVTNINTDLSVPSPAPLPWTTHNVFRARPAVDNLGNDLQVQITETCYTGCDSQSHVQIAVQPFNTGFLPVQAGVPVSLYAADGSALSLIEVWTIPDPIGPGEMLEGHVFDLTVGQVGTSGFVVRIDDDGTGVGVIYECDEDNNEDTWVGPDCDW